MHSKKSLMLARLNTRGHRTFLQKKYISKVWIFRNSGNFISLWFPLCVSCRFSLLNTLRKRSLSAKTYHENCKKGQWFWLKSQSRVFRNTLWITDMALKGAWELAVHILVGLGNKLSCRVSPLWSVSTAWSNIKKTRIVPFCQKKAIISVTIFWLQTFWIY